MTPPPVPPREPLPPSRWEEPDPVGDAFRVSRGTKIVLVSSATTLVAVTLLVVGDRTMRVFGGVLLAWSLLALIPAAVATARARSRIRDGRALIVGDPMRPEGIDPDDVPR